MRFHTVCTMVFKLGYQKRFPNALATILEAFAPYSSEIEGFVVESTYNWYWLVDGLMEAGYRVHLANPAAIQQYSGLKYTNDHSDARWLAHLLRLGYCLKDISIRKPREPCAICCVSAHTWSASTRRMCSVCKTSWYGIPRCAPQYQADSRVALKQGLLPKSTRSWRSPVASRCLIA